MNYRVIGSFLVALAFVFSACNKDLIDANEANDAVGTKVAASAIKWNGEADKAFAITIKEARNDTRKNASGPKITSNAHSADFPGIYFIWDSKQKDNGYLKVAAWLLDGNGEGFEGYDWFVLTSKESNTYWDFKIEKQAGQKATIEDVPCYVFYIPKVYNNKNINMVFVSEAKLGDCIAPAVTEVSFYGMAYDAKKGYSSKEYSSQYVMLGFGIDWEKVWKGYKNAFGYTDCTLKTVGGEVTEASVTGWCPIAPEGWIYNCDNALITKLYPIVPLPEPVIVNIGFIGYYLNNGNVLSTSFYWQELKEGDCINWKAVDAAYDAWVAEGGLVPLREEWITSGYASFTFSDGAKICFGDFNIGQLEDYYKQYFVDPGYVPPCTPEDVSPILDAAIAAFESGKNPEIYCNWADYLTYKQGKIAEAEDWNTCEVGDYVLNFDFTLIPKLPTCFKIEEDGTLVFDPTCYFDIRVLPQTNGHNWLKIIVNGETISGNGDYNTNNWSIRIKPKVLTEGTYEIIIYDTDGRLLTSVTFVRNDGCVIII